jgi:hypothetical protein
MTISLMRVIHQLSHKTKIGIEWAVCRERTRKPCESSTGETMPHGGADHQLVSLTSDNRPLADVMVDDVILSDPDVVQLTKLIVGTTCQSLVSAGTLPHCNRSCSTGADCFWETNWNLSMNWECVTVREPVDQPLWLQYSHEPSWWVVRCVS